MAVEALEFGEEVCIWEERIHRSHRVVGVERGVQHASHVPDGPHVPSRDVPGRSDEREGFGTQLVMGV